MFGTSGTYTITIEEPKGTKTPYGFHLGTDERIAKQIVVDKFRTRAEYHYPIESIALYKDKVLINTYDGNRWASEY